MSGVCRPICSARRRTERPGRSRSPFPTASFRLSTRGGFQKEGGDGLVLAFCRSHEVSRRRARRRSRFMNSPCIMTRAKTTSDFESHSASPSGCPQAGCPLPSASAERAGERSRSGCIGRRLADRTVCSARAPNTTREARAFPTLNKCRVTVLVRRAASDHPGRVHGVGAPARIDSRGSTKSILPTFDKVPRPTGAATSETLSLWGRGGRSRP